MLFLVHNISKLIGMLLILLLKSQINDPQASSLIISENEGRHNHEANSHRNSNINASNNLG